jgi:hypothetical protein
VHDSKVIEDNIQINATFTYEYESEEEKVALIIDVSKTPENNLRLNF